MSKTTTKQTKPRPLIYIEWEDAMATAEWKCLEDALQWGEKDKYIIREVGWVLAEKPTYLLIASSNNPKTEFAEHEQFANIERIPKTWIRKRIDLTKYIPQNES